MSYVLCPMSLSIRVTLLSYLSHMSHVLFVFVRNQREKERNSTGNIKSERISNQRVNFRENFSVFQHTITPTWWEFHPHMMKIPPTWWKFHPHDENSTHMMRIPPTWWEFHPITFRRRRGWPEGPSRAQSSYPRISKSSIKYTQFSIFNER